MSKTINDKLKASVKASLDKAKTSKKKKQATDEPADLKMDDDIRDYIGLPRTATQRPREICVYKLKYHNRARLDHSKYPNERMHKVENSPLFATHKDGEKYCRELEKKDKENMYFAEMTWVPEPEVPKDVMKKIAKRGW